MSLFRTAIRVAAVAALMNATSAKERVFDSRVTPLDEGQEYPIILVSTENEPATKLDASPTRYMREANLVTNLIVSYVPEKEDSVFDIERKLAAKLDLVAHELERAMTVDPFLGKTLALELELSSFDPEFDTDGEVPKGGARIAWKASFTEELPDTSESALVPFNRAHIETDGKVGDSTASGVDDVELPQ